MNILVRFVTYSSNTDRYANAIGYARTNLKIINGLLVEGCMETFSSFTKNVINACDFPSEQPQRGGAVGGTRGWKL